jgi:bifunctional UDP-N-acetylglucosamine pyrophosphorylase/glucosamine-1-phosphate N-acetyltransferase
MMRTCVAVVLAAGEGKRMRSRLPKVLHPIGRLPMIAHVLRALEAAGVDRIAVVIGGGQPDVAREIAATSPDASIHIQDPPQGTADAAKAARAAIEAGADDILIVFGDTPFLSAEAILPLRERLAQGAAVAVAGMFPDNREGYGRLIMDGEQLIAIRGTV